MTKKIIDDYSNIYFNVDNIGWNWNSPITQTVAKLALLNGKNNVADYIWDQHDDTIKSKATADEYLELFDMNLAIDDVHLATLFTYAPEIGMKTFSIKSLMPYIKNS